jgi:hypothetical protein
LLRAFLRLVFGRGDATGGAGSQAVTPGTAAYAAAQKRLVAAIGDLRQVLKTGSAEEIATAITVFKAKAVADDLEARELAGEVSEADHMLAVLAYSDRLNRGEGVQAVAVMADGEPTYFRAKDASRETARDDDYGRFDIGDKGLFYDGTKRLTIVWSKVLTIGVEATALIVHPTRGGRPHTFYLKDERTARLAHAVATTIFKQQAAPPATSTRRERSAPPAVTRPAESSRATVDLGSPAAGCNFNIVGESHYQGRLRNISASAGRSFTALLMPEPTNAFDPNAIRVVAEGAGTIGYLSREDAVHYAPVLELLGRHAHVGSCMARLTGGTPEKRSFGVLLNLRDVDELLVFVRRTLEPGAATPTNDQPF